MSKPAHADQPHFELRRVAAAVALAGTSAVAWVALASATTGGAEHVTDKTKGVPTVAAMGSNMHVDGGPARFYAHRIG